MYKTAHHSFRIYPICIFGLLDICSGLEVNCKWKQPTNQPAPPEKLQNLRKYSHKSSGNFFHFFHLFVICFIWKNKTNVKVFAIVGRKICLKDRHFVFMPGFAFQRSWPVGLHPMCIHNIFLLTSNRNDDDDVTNHSLKAVKILLRWWWWWVRRCSHFIQSNSNTRWRWWRCLHPKNNFPSCEVLDLQMNGVELQWEKLKAGFFKDLPCRFIWTVLHFIVLHCIVCNCIAFYYIALYCIQLYYILLYCIVLYAIVLHFIILHCIVFNCITFYCIALYCMQLYYILLYCIALYAIVLHFIVLHCIVCNCITFYCIQLYYISLYSIVLHFIVMYFIVFNCIVLYFITLCRLLRH